MSLGEWVRHIFLSPDEPRLRAGWRLLVQLFLLGMISFIVGIPAVILYLFWPDTLMWVLLIASDIPMLVSVPVARKWIDRRSIVSLGLRLDRRAVVDLLSGVGIAVVLIAIIFVVEWALGWLQFEGFAWQEQSIFLVGGNLAFWLALFILVGFSEELLSRGYQLQNLEEGLNTFWAVVLSSVVFGALHLTNDHASLVAAVGITFAGVFLAYPYLRTRQLWLSIGLHIGWNFSLGPVFGFPVSGMDSYQLLRTEVSGPEILTGGAFGPEAGLIVLPVLALGALMVWAVTRGRLEKGDPPLSKS